MVYAFEPQLTFYIGYVQSSGGLGDGGREDYGWALEAYDTMEG